MTDNIPCGCKTYRDGKTMVREVCARHLMLHDAKGNRITFDEPLAGPHLGRAIERFTRNKGLKR